MKPLLTFVFLLFLFFGICYIGGSFAFVSFNIAEWPIEDRKIFTIMCGFFSLLVAAIITGMLNDPTTKSGK